MVLAEEVLQGEGAHDPVMGRGRVGLAVGPPARLDQRLGQPVLVGPLLDRHRLVVGVVLVVAAEQFFGTAVELRGDDAAPFGVQLAGDLGHAVPVLPGPQPVLGFHPLPRRSAVILGVALHELVEPLAELERALPGTRRQLRFMGVQRGTRRRVGLAAGGGDGFGVFVGDGPVLQSVLGLR
ncbi:MAG: hypothetical protein ABWZ13_09155 [Acidimicrobiales bacterium]